MIPHALLGPVLFCAASAFVCWLVSVLVDNYSQVDRLWSILPSVYMGWFAAQQGFADARLDLMFGLSLLWGARLTYNFARKGGYRWSGEDYRWPVLRQRMGRVGFQLFNATFIAPYQNLLLLLITLPAYTAAEAKTPLGWADGVCALAFLLFLVGETIADEQQWRFHEDKRQRSEAGEAIPEPFLRRGLFAFSRHPNFFCEMAMWWCMYGFAVAATGAWWHPTIAGTVLLTLLFQGSTTFTEQLTRAKYPSYAEYQARTSRLIPLP